MEVGFGFSLPNWLILLFMVILLLHLYVDKKFKYWKQQGIESQTKLEFFTGLKNIRRSLPNNIVDTYNKHGRVFGMCMPVTQLWISEPELIKHILVKDFATFRNRMELDFGDPTINKMLSVMLDEDWKRIRNLMSPTFTSSRMRKMAYLVKQNAESLANHFTKKAETGEEFDCKQYISAFTIDTTAITAFATKLNALGNENDEFVKNARNVTNRNLSFLTFFALTVAPKLIGYLKLEFFPKKILNYFRSVVLKILEERKERKIRGNDFLQLMMDAQQGTLENSAEDLKEVENEINNYQVQPKHKSMTLEEIVAQSVLFIIAGHDATTTALTFFCYQMALHPECQEKLSKEIHDTWKQHGDIDFDIAMKMPYLDASLNEALRIQNPGVMISRVASADYDLADTGLKIKKGTTIIIPTHGIHQDPEWYPEPEKFKPERFLPENKDSIHPYTFLPFGDGPRNCIGMRFVSMVMKLSIVYMMRDIKFVATDETRKPLKYYFGQNLQVQELKLKVEKRTPFD